MFNHYLQVAFRYLRKNKEVSLVNILGLTVGILACLLLAHAIKMESGFDAFLQDTDLISRFFYGTSEESGTMVKSKNDLELPQLNNITPNAPFAWTPEPSRQFSYAYLIIATVVFMLVIACVNFVNFTTIGSIQASKERDMLAGLRAMKKLLSWRSLAESLLLSFVGLLAAMLGIRFILPYLNHVSGLSLTLDDMLSFDSLSFLLLSVILTGIISGLYALFFSSFKPFIRLRNVLKIPERSTGLRKSLVVFQFSIAIAMILGPIVIFDQLNYLTYKKLSFDQEQKVLFSTPHENLKESTACIEHTIPRSLSKCGSSLNSSGICKENSVQSPSDISGRFMDHDILSVKHWLQVLPEFLLSLRLLSDCSLCKFFSEKLFI